MKKTSRWHLTPRQAFTLIGVVLAIALIALVLYLLLYLSPAGFTELLPDTGAGGLRPIMIIRGPGTGENPSFSRPMGAAFSPKGDIYAVDTENNRVCVFDDNGKYLFEFGGFGVAKPAQGVEATWDEGELNSPLGIDIDQDGTVYVADFHNDSISVFDADGTFLRRFPDPALVVGRGASGQDGTGIAVTDVAVLDGKVYATDTYQVLIFTTEGELLGQFGKPGLEPGDLDHPNGIDVDQAGVIYVADSNNNRVTAFDFEGAVLWSVGERVTEVAREVEYTFGLPRGIALTEDDTLLVVDTFEFDVAETAEQGVVARYGSRGVEPGQFNFANSIDIKGPYVVIADKENDRIQVLELVR